MTSNLPSDPDDAPVEATAVMALLLIGFGLPATAAAAAFAIGSLDDILQGLGVALLVWLVGGVLALVQPLRTGPADEPVPPALRWGVVAMGVAGLALVMSSSAPLLPWTLVLLVGPFFAWITASLWLMARRKG